ncbi:hypothetical protein BC567DRAFT_215807 [Phyllosticta citribraziliensis]
MPLDLPADGGGRAHGWSWGWGMTRGQWRLRMVTSVRLAAEEGRGSRESQEEWFV